MQQVKQKALPARILLHALLVLAVLAFFSLTNAVAAGSALTDDVLPPINTEVKYVEDKEVKADDPDKAWEEWGETEQTRKNPFPKRQRKVEVGMDVNTIMGMAMRQPKVVVAVLAEEFGANTDIGQRTTRKFHNQMAAAGIGCRLWFVPKGRQVVANCETIRDGHMAKDYMIIQHEIIRTVIDNVPFSPKPRPKDDDDDDEDDDEDDSAGKAQDITAVNTNDAEATETQEKMDL